MTRGDVTSGAGALQLRGGTRPAAPVLLVRELICERKGRWAVASMARDKSLRRRGEEAAPVLRDDIARLRSRNVIAELHVDRGYIGSSLVQEVLAARNDVICKPWVSRNGKLFAKSDFQIDMRARTIRCPAGEVERFEPGSVVEFDPETCARCPLRSQCTMASPATGRSVTIAEDEQLQHRLRKLAASPKGRERLRERVAVEHRLAHVGRKQGRRARYRGVRKNLFDIGRAAAVVNL